MVFVTSEQALSDVTVGHLQFDCLRALWTLPARTGTIHEVVDIINRNKVKAGAPELAYTTVLTVMRNLHKRGITTRDRLGRRDAYKATRTKDEFLAKLGREFLANFFNGDVKKLQEAVGHG